MSVEDLLDHIGEEAGYDDENDGEPGRAAGQQLHEDEIHVLCVEERPDDASIEEREDEVKGDRAPRHKMAHPGPEMCLYSKL